GIHNADIYYNLGNCYYRLGNHGYAILNYLRALRIEPNNKAVQSNLRFLYTLVQDKQIPEAEDSLSAWFLTIYRAISLNTFAIITLALIVSAIGLINWMIIFFRNREKTIPVFILMIVLVSALGFGSLTAIKWNQYANSNQAVLIAQTAIGYSGPGTEYTRVFTIHEGNVFDIVQSRENWVQIQLQNGLGGWVQRPLVEIVNNK
ncbi:MAG: tetratricopeptide repeat protein, partial [Candidatus Cloacimonetes bacterium]|nr:tetratricopeptide repeat protein [Candidatus Cloacimonadota bacterium]